MKTIIKSKTIRILLKELVIEVEKSLDQLLSLKYSIEFKEDNSPVSEIDFLLQQKIINFFSSKFKNAIYISEELDNNPIYLEDGALYIVIDPLDGTENFVSGIPIWGIAVSVWEYPNHLGSMLFLPELRKSIISGDKIKYNESRIVGYSSSLDSVIISKIDYEKENRIMGCSVFNFYNVIHRSYDKFYNYKGAHIWDSLAGLVIAREHGCIVYCDGREYSGEFLEPNKKHIFEVRH